MRLLFHIRPLIPFLLALFSACSKNTSERESYTRLISAFEEAERAENVAFEKLVFRSAETPPPPGSTMAYKVMLRDQLDRPWVFLAGKSAAKHGAVAVYRIYNLFGVDTPETHYKKLSINGVEIDGIVQRHYPEAGPLRTEHFFLSPSSLEYIAQNHALSWLVANHSVLNQQFRITQAAPAGLTKLENGIDW